MNNYSFLDIINTEIVQYKNDERYYISFNLFLNFGDVYGYTLFVPISEKLSQSYDGNEIYEFIENIKLLDNTAEIADYMSTGIDNFIPGEDYFVSRSLGDYISMNEEYIMPNYTIQTFNGLSQNTTDYEDLSDTNNKDFSNIWYFIEQNNYLNYTFSEDELNNLYSTFFSIILDNTTFTDYSYGTNAIYKAVMDYYKNFQSDSATVLMNLILGSNYSVNIDSTSSCGCSSGNSSASGQCAVLNGYTNNTNNTNTQSQQISFDTMTCQEKYTNAMFEYLKMMLSDKNYYCDWMYFENDALDKVPNTLLIDKLIDLLTQLLKSGYNLNMLGDDTSDCGCHTRKHCPDRNNSISSTSCANETTILNYIKLLNWIKNDEVSKNINKIYIYGKQFAEILPFLYF